MGVPLLLQHILAELAVDGAEVNVDSVRLHCWGGHPEAHIGTDADHAYSATAEARKFFPEGCAGLPTILGVVIVQMGHAQSRLPLAKCALPPSDVSHARSD